MGEEEGRKKEEGKGKGKGKEKRSEDIRVGKEQKKLRTLMVGHDAFVNEQRLSPNTSSRTSAVALPDMLNPSWLESAYVVVVEESVPRTEKRIRITMGVSRMAFRERRHTQTPHRSSRRSQRLSTAQLL